MPSPFPGMNPYFERPGVWPGFHTTFIVHLREAIVPVVAPRYNVDVEQSLFIDRSPDDDAVVIPDVFVSETRRPKRRGGGATAVAAAPVTATVPQPARRPARRLVLRDGRTGAVVTVIEVLSPSNKTGDDRTQYLMKRAEYLASDASLVEIDLLRGGPRMPFRGLPACDYYVMVARPGERPRVGVWPLRVRDELPAIPIPLRGEPEPLIPLKPVLDEVYDRSGYRHNLYDGPPDPPLSPADATWARRFVPKGAA